MLGIAELQQKQPAGAGTERGVALISGNIV